VSQQQIENLSSATVRVLVVDKHAVATTDNFPTKRYVNNPLGTKDRSGHGHYAAELFRALRPASDASTANGIDTSMAVPSPVD
jgi:hypothetical protein